MNARPDEALLGSLQPVPLVHHSWRVVGSGGGRPVAKREEELFGVTLV